jgi:hypothetical protein
MRESPQHLPMSMSLRILYQRVFRLLLSVIPEAAEPVKAGVIIVIVFWELEDGLQPGIADGQRMARGSRFSTSCAVAPIRTRAGNVP